MKLTGVEELGILDDSYMFWTPKELVAAQPHRPAERFAGLINEKLAKSERKEIFIYVHGFRVIFENPLLIATELWHFLGYDGVFIAYAWPSTPRGLAYVSDIETAAYSSNTLRILLEYLAAETDAERINIVGYSAGTRVVIDTLFQLALEHHGQNKAAIQEALRIGKVILVGSDYDLNLFGLHLESGLLNVPEKLTIYMSETDSALRASRFIFRRQRLGQMWNNRNMKPLVADYLRNTEDLIVIDVTDEV